MAVSLYKLELPEHARSLLVAGCYQAYVWANSAAEAKSLANRAQRGDPKDIWDNATATAQAAPSNYEGWTYELSLDGEVKATYTAAAADTVDLIGAALVTALNTAQDLEDYVFTLTVADETPIIATYTGLAGDDIDDVAAGLVTSLNSSLINGAAYTAGTQTLKVAETTDALGDELITLLVTDPDDVDVSSAFTGAQTEGGSSGAALVQVLRNDGFIFSASYNSGTNVLTVAAAVDRCGDQTFTMTVTPPDGFYSAVDENEPFVDTGFYSTVVDDGSIGDVVQVTLLDVLPSAVSFVKP